MPPLVEQIPRTNSPVLMTSDVPICKQAELVRYFAAIMKKNRRGSLESVAVRLFFRVAED
jgi:hypothetical protein